MILKSEGIQEIYLFYNIFSSHWQMVLKDNDKKFLKMVCWDNSNVMFKINLENDITRIENILRMNTLHQLPIFFKKYHKRLNVCYRNKFKDF
jgi:hypothetical protein